MNQTEKVLHLVRTAQSALNEEVARCRAGAPTVGPLNQLTKVQTTLGNIALVVQSGVLPAPRDRLSGVGRMITDSWPNDSELGNMVLEAEQAYRAL
jgi:hypothetical protein